LYLESLRMIRPGTRASGSRGETGNGSQVHRFRGRWETHTHRTHLDTRDHTSSIPIALNPGESHANKQSKTSREMESLQLSEKLSASWSENRKWRWACEKCCGYTARYTHTQMMKCVCVHERINCFKWELISVFVEELCVYVRAEWNIKLMMQFIKSSWIQEAESVLSALPSSVCFALYVKATKIAHTRCKHTFMLQKKREEQQRWDE